MFSISETYSEILVYNTKLVGTEIVQKLMSCTHVVYYNLDEENVGVTDPDMQMVGSTTFGSAMLSTENVQLNDDSRQVLCTTNMKIQYHFIRIRINSCLNTIHISCITQT